MGLRQGGLFLIVLWTVGQTAVAETMGGMGSPSDAAPYGAPVGDDMVYVHGLLDQLEIRTGEGAGALRWDGEAWIGTDYDRLWLKAEGEGGEGSHVSDGRLEALYDRPITAYYDAQAGLRYDLDSRPGRAWAAFGVEGLAPYFVNVDAAGYVSNDGHLAARAQVSYDQLLTQKLIVSPEIEANAYSKDDPGRRIGAGLCNIDAGLRLRYEITRKIAPYVGVVYEGAFGRTANFLRALGESTGAVKVAIGLRGWF
jgi:copper resistance protein B